ncbi:hypothetical protein A2U01_0081256, partial [Trifolium medium]|nr:hypothetical protein [Trifolium medium]
RAAAAKNPDPNTRSTTVAPTVEERPKRKSTPARERRWCGREGLVHHRIGYLHGKGTVGFAGGEGELRVRVRVRVSW